jgi:hypothetical protein
MGGIDKNAPRLLSFMTHGPTFLTPADPDATYARFRTVSSKAMMIILVLITLCEESQPRAAGPDETHNNNDL